MLKTTKQRLAMTLALGLAVAATTPTSWGKEETLSIDRLPREVRREVEEATRGASNVQVLLVAEEGGRGQEDYFVRYIDPSGREMKLRIEPNGKVLEQGPTRAQRRKDEEARLALAKTEEEQNRIRQERALEREREDRQQFEAYRAAQAAAPVGPEHRDQRGMSLKELSEEYNSTDRRRVGWDALPPGARDTFKLETIGTTDVDYYQYTVEGRTFYSSHYDIGADRHMVCRVDDRGKLLGKNELPPAVAVPVAAERAESITLEALPEPIRESLRRETRGARDVAYYRFLSGNRLAYYSVHYTAENNHRFDLHLAGDGRVISRDATALQPGDRRYERDELGR